MQLLRDLEMHLQVHLQMHLRMHLWLTNVSLANTQELNIESNSSQFAPPRRIP
jgi:hypothetical protein